MGSEMCIRDRLTIKESLLDLTTIRPSNLSLVPGGIPKLAVSFGSPVRKGMVFDIEVSNNSSYIKNSQLLSAPIVSNGYGVVYIGGFKSNGGHYIALLSPERGMVNVAVFDVGQSFDLLQSKTIKTEDARYLLGKDIQPTLSNSSKYITGFIHLDFFKISTILPGLLLPTL